MINMNYWLSSELSITLAPDEEAYIDIRGYLSMCFLSLKFSDLSGAAAIIQASLASNDALSQYSAVKSDFIWEDIKVNGVTYSEVTFDITSVSFNAPSVLYIKNTSTSGQTVSLFLRGNR